MKLMRVKDKWTLNWPENVLGMYEDPKRGGGGTIVDLDAPLEAEMFCKGQEYKLEPAPHGTKEATPIEHTKARVLIAEYRKKRGLAQSAASDAAPAKAASKPTQPDLPAVDLPGKKSPAKA